LGDLAPDPAFAEALQHAGGRPETGDQNQKRHWSESFANGCAVATATALRGPSVGDKRILPASLADGTEPLTPLGAGTSKRIDVTVADPVLGLEVGLSLKGLNFRDRKRGNFDKNLTGRLYELADEVRLVHEHLPHAFMVGVFFLPLDATMDKIKGNSSFANTVTKLRERTGRLDPASPPSMSRLRFTILMEGCRNRFATPRQSSLKAHPAARELWKMCWPRPRGNSLTSWVCRPIGSGLSCASKDKTVLSQHRKMLHRASEWLASGPQVFCATVVLVGLLFTVSRQCRLPCIAPSDVILPPILTWVDTQPPLGGSVEHPNMFRLRPEYILFTVGGIAIVQQTQIECSSMIVVRLAVMEVYRELSNALICNR